MADEDKKVDEAQEKGARRRAATNPAPRRAAGKDPLAALRAV